MIAARCEKCDWESTFASKEEFLEIFPHEKCLNCGSIGRESKFTTWPIPSESSSLPKDQRIALGYALGILDGMVGSVRRIDQQHRDAAAAAAAKIRGAFQINLLT